MEFMFNALKVELLEEIKKAINDSLEAMEERVVTLEHKCLSLQEDLEKQKEKSREYITSDFHNKILLETKALAVANEQHSRKSNIRIFGLKEESNEDCVKVVLQLLNNKLKVNLQEDDIDVAHRVGRKSQKPRAMIVKFMRRKHRFVVMRKRKTLKGSGTTIADDLARGIHQLYNRVRDHVDVTDAWTWDGKVYIKDYRGKVYQIKYGQTVDDVFAAD